MASYRQTLSYLFGLQTRGIKLGLGNIRSLVAVLDDPHLRYPTIHIAGTNGKGSTAAMIAAVLRSSGYKTGLYTSPHLIDFTERIRIDGQPIRTSKVVSYVRELRPHIDSLRATFFEATTAVAFRYFADNHIDVAVVETGLGGRLDATNVVKPVATVITSIDLEHTDWLGNTLTSIAREKAGIMKGGVPCFLGNVSASALSTIKAVARKKGARTEHALRTVRVRNVREALSGFECDIKTPRRTYRNLRCSLPGEFQVTNLALSIRVSEFLERQGFSRITETSICRGLADVRKYTGFMGRFQTIHSSPHVIIDVAHNPAAVRSLMASVRRLYVGKVVLLIGVMKDKDLRAMVAAAAPLVRVAIAVAPKTPRAAEPREIARAFNDMGVRCYVAKNIGVGMTIAMQEIYPGEMVMVTGSHYVVGEVLKKIERR